MNKSKLDSEEQDLLDRFEAGEFKSIVAKNDVFDRFIISCEKADAPNEKLREAAIGAGERVGRNK